MRLVKQKRRVHVVYFAIFDIARFSSAPRYYYDESAATAFLSGVRSVNRNSPGANNLPPSPVHVITILITYPHGRIQVHRS